MAIQPVNVSRISNGLRANFTLQSLQRTQVDLFREQNRIATGRQFVTASEDPVAATRALELTQALARHSQFEENLTHADQLLVAADSAMVEVNDLLIQAATMASQNLSNLTSADERIAVAELVSGIRVQLQSVGNRQLNGRYIFAGKATIRPPFVDAPGGIAYIGDTQELVTAISDNAVAPLTVSGDVLFGALSSRIASNVDLSPSLTEGTRVEDLAGATGGGVRLGTLVFNEPSGAGAFSVNLSSATTAGDIVRLINEAAAQAGSGLTASIGDTGLVINPGSSAVSILDTSTGVVASDLGIMTRDPSSTTITGVSLQPRLTRLTPISALKGGEAIDLTSGLQISNSGQSVTVDLTGVETVQDLLNKINNSGLYVDARVNDAGSGIDVVNQVSGSSLSIGENGGTTATDLGIRSLNLDTPLSRLNGGRGVNVDPTEDDLRIVNSSGAEITVNLDGVTTMGELIDRINESSSTASGAVVASLAANGNGIVLSDGSGGDGTLQVVSLNQSTAAQDLGLTDLTTTDDGDSIGADPNPVRTDGILTALIDLERSLRADDTRAIAAAGEQVDLFIDEVTRIHGIVGARSASMRERLNQVEESVTTAKVLLSDIKDLDYAEAITKLQAASTQLQASLQTNSVLLNLSLLDYLS